MLSVYKIRGSVKMEKLISWIVLIIGVILVLPLLGLTFLADYQNWLIAIGVLVIGIVRLVKK